MLTSGSSSSANATCRLCTNRGVVQFCGATMNHLKSFPNGGIELGVDELSILNSASRAILTNSRILCADSLSRAKRTWHLIPKHHALLHLFVFAIQSKLNPGFAMTFSDEDFVGWVSKTLEALHAVTCEHQFVARFVDYLRAEFAM